MWRRLILGTCVGALGFGSLALSAMPPAGAYSSPSAGNIARIAGTGVAGYSGDGGHAGSAQLQGGGQVTLDQSNGNVVFTDTGNNAVRVIVADECICYGQAMSPDRIYTIAGNGTPGNTGDTGPGPSGELNAPTGIAVVPAGPYAGTVLIADTNNSVIRVVPMNDGTFFGNPYTAGDIYRFAGSGIPGFSGDGGTALAAQFNNPYGVAIDNFGNLLIADTLNQRIRVVAGNTGTFYGQAMTAVSVYTIAGTGVGGFSGDGHVASAARLDSPLGMTVDLNGNVFIVDQNNQRIRAIAGTTGTFYGVNFAIDNIYTVAGDGNAGFEGDGPLAKATSLYYPREVALDSVGNLLIADDGNQRIRAVAAGDNVQYGQLMRAAHMYTIAGDGTNGSSGDGGPADIAQLSDPTGVGVDFDGNVLIEDFGSFKLRAVAPCTASSGSPSQLTISTSVSPDTLRPPQSDASQWTSVVHNPSAVDETCVTVTFQLASIGDAGTLNGLYYEVSQGAGCTFDFNENEQATCFFGTVAANSGNNPALDATATVAIEAKGLTAGDEVDGNTYTASNLNGGDQKFVTVDIAAPTPGTVSSFVPPNGSTFTDKKTSPFPTARPGGAHPLTGPAATIIAKMKLPKRVTEGTFAILGGGAHPNAAAPLVTSAGSVVTMNRFDQSSDSVLCPGNSCKGNIITLDPFVNYNDPKHPATLTLTWDPSVVDPLHLGSVYIHTDSNPSLATALPLCIKTKTGYTNLPCFSKTKLSTKNVYTVTVLILSSNDPGFARK